MRSCRVRCNQAELLTDIGISRAVAFVAAVLGRNSEPIGKGDVKGAEGGSNSAVYRATVDQSEAYASPKHVL